MEDTQLVLERIERKVDIISVELNEHKERHALVISMIMSTGKLILGITTFFTLLGGAIIGFHNLLKGE